MKLSKFRFSLPQELIASYPAEERDESRLMVVHRKSRKIEHRRFKDLVDYVEEGDALVLNDTRVFPARLYGHKEKTGAKIEVLLLRRLNEELCIWDALVDPARKIRVGNKVYFGDGILVAEVLDNTTSRGRTISFQFDGDPDDFLKVIDDLGNPPLPNEIPREMDPMDRERYQTIYARESGAVAVPSAGLHFTRHLIKRLELADVHISPLTLHMGLGNHRPVDVEDLSKFKMLSENYKIAPETVRNVNEALDNKKNVIAVGVSTAKALETSISMDEHLKPSVDGWTNLFIFPPYKFKICRALITNFHLPESTMLMLAYAFGGYDLISEAYDLAIKKKYRFFSYGDAMLIL